LPAAPVLPDDLPVNGKDLPQENCLPAAKSLLSLLNKSQMTENQSTSFHLKKAWQGKLRKTSADLRCFLQKQSLFLVE